MSETLSLVIGAILLILIIYDFFFTTLSGSGAGFITRTVSAVSHTFLQFLTRLFGRHTYRTSGLIINLFVLLVWISVVWIGLFLIYSSHPEAIVNSQGKIATATERLYFTGYVLSTLGMGNFYPTTITFETLSSIFSFFGFIFFTSSMTYFLSVSTALINKRTLARSIQNFGKTPEKIADKILKLDSSYAYQQIQVFQELLDKHAVNHQAYPVVHYYSHPEPAVCLSINLVRLDEALSIILSSKKGKQLQEEIILLRSAITAYLNHLDKNYSWSLPKGEDAVSSKPLQYRITGMNPAALDQRRKILRGLLRTEGFKWQDISLRNQRRAKIAAE